MRVAITGSSGLIGTSLIESLTRDGHTVHRLVRDRARARARDGDIYWSVARAEIDADDLAGLDGVVHLAGKPIEAKHWSEATKAEFHDSRVKGTHLLTQALASLDDPPPVLVSQSGSGYYGDRGDERLTEASSPGTSFMAQVCVDWEASADPARDAGIRVVHPRTGVVMAPEGPLIQKVRVPFKLGVGGRVGSGRQWVPWISIDDEVRALRFLLDREDLSGPVNLVGPEPIRNTELTTALGEVWNRPTVMPVPTFAIWLLYGGMGRMLATESQRMAPVVLREAGFEWRHPDIRTALHAVLAR